MPTANRHHRLMLSLLLLDAACGTVVGNPKKPAGGSDTTAASAISYQLPAIGVSLPASGTSSALALVDTDHLGDGGRQLLVSWATRTQRSLNLVDTLTAHINKIIAAERAAGNSSEPLVFTGRGSDGQLSGRVQTLGAAGTATPYSYEAVVCNSGKFVTDVKWSESGDEIAVLRDFSQKPDGLGDAFTMLSAITVDRATTTTLTIDLQGSYADTILASSAGTFLTEHSQVTELASGAVDVSMVGDRSAGANASGSYSGATYLVGKLMPASAATDAATLAEFVGYFADLPACIAAGPLLETASDLWQPTFTGPHFCSGRPLGGARFATRQQFYATLDDLQPLGLMPKAKLTNLTTGDAPSCP